MTKLKERLDQAGVDTARAKLYAAAQKVLTLKGQNATAALPEFVAAVRADTGLLIALLKDQIRPAALGFLQSVAGDMAGGRFGSDAHAGGAARHDKSAAKGHATRDVQTRSVPAANGGAGQDRAVVQRPGARSAVSVREPTRRQVTAAGNAGKALAHAVFGWRIGADMAVGDITRPDLVNLSKKIVIGGHVVGKLMELPFPDDTTPVKTFADPKAIEAIRASAYSYLDRLGVTNHGR